MSGLQEFVVITATLIWAVAWIAAFVEHDYSGVTTLTPVMPAIVAGIFGAQFIRRRKNGNGDAA